MAKDTVYFSSFRESGKLDNAMAISRTVPRSFRGPRITELAPTMAMVQRYKKNPDGQWQWFIKEYLELLYSRDDLDSIYEQCIGRVLLCHCKPDVLCHRIILAKTFEIEFGAEVSEIGGWRVPFNKPFEKIPSFGSIMLSDVDGVGDIDAVGNYRMLVEILRGGA